MVVKGTDVGSRLPGCFGRMNYSFPPSLFSVFLFRKLEMKTELISQAVIRIH